MAVEIAPLQLYSSALIFAPEFIREIFQGSNGTSQLRCAVDGSIFPSLTATDANGNLACQNQRVTPSTLTSMNNLAYLSQSQGKCDEAEPVLQQTLALREKVLGKGHPDTIDSMNSLTSLQCKNRGNEIPEVRLDFY
jgi:hypothetical protein